MKSHTHGKLQNLFIGLATMFSAVFLVTPLFEKDPQQCELMQPVDPKKNDGSSEENN